MNNNVKYCFQVYEYVKIDNHPVREMSIFNVFHETNNLPSLF